MEDVIIRRVIKEDNKTLAALIRNVFDEFGAPHNNTVYSDATTDNLYELFQKERSVLWVAEWQNKILGCCGIYATEGLDNGCAELAKFYLLQDARGKGIGKKLMLQCFQSAKEMCYHKLYIESMPQFSQALSMYEKYGFVNIDQPLGNSGHTSCNIWMLKHLEHNNT